MISIRVGSTSEAQKLADLQVATFSQAYEGDHANDDIVSYCRSHYTLDQAQKVLDDTKASCCFGLVNDVIAGYYLLDFSAEAAAELIDSKPKQWVELKQIYVLSQAYGSGLGRALFDHAIEAAKSAGCDGLWLCVSDLNLRAQAFYRKLGFTGSGAGPTLVVGEDRLSSSIMQISF